MPTVTGLSNRDVDGVLGLVSEAAATDGDQPFELDAIERLQQLIPAPYAGYFEYRCCGRDGNLYGVETVYEPIEWHTDAVRATIASWPLFDGRCGHWPETAVKLSDLLTRRELRRNPWYLTVMRPRSCEYECKLWLPAPAGIVRGFFLVRGPGDRDFDERDRAVLTVLRPHLAAIRERWERRHRSPGLTDRECEVVRLVAAGLTNREIADRLVIASGTVRTHLENIFEKLGVHTRTAAATRAFGPGA